MSTSAANNKTAEAPRKGEFEKSLTRLEEVVKRLESVELSLDEAMKLFEEGVKKADGKIAAEPFEPEDESS
jgi:exonuclease VII small subunit